MVHTPRRRIIPMSISGSRLRSSTATHTAQMISPTASRESVRAEPQPQVVVSETASSASEMPIAIRPPATQLIRPGARIGDSGT